MNEDPHRYLERYVDRAVGSLRATPRRRSIVREELLAHLFEAFAQELQRAGDSAAALEAAARRFGNCRVLAKELEASVPALERVVFLLFYRERLMWRLLVLVGVLGALFGTALILPALAKLKHLGGLTGQGEPLMTIAVALIIGVVVVTAGVHLLVWGIARRLRKPA